MDDKKYWVAFNKSPKINWKTLSALLKNFGNLENAWNATKPDFFNVKIEPKIIDEIFKIRNETDPDSEIEKLDKLGIEVIIYKDRTYPKLLKEIYSPPAVLYVKGEILPKDEYALAVVGTRRLSDYGREVAYDMAYHLAKQGLTIVSGLALGIDTIAHRSALEAGGRTIAVLGSGLDIIYPTINRKLAESISKNGAVISEFPLGTPALKQNFPARNRIVAGLALGTCVVEAPEISGALITARDSLEQNREVFAVPGNIYDKTSVGPNNLIKLGAKVVTSYEDILEELNLEKIDKFLEAAEIIPDNDEEKVILDILSKKPIHIDLIIKKSEMDTATVNSVVTLMEIKGKIRNLGGSNYVKR